MNPRNEPAAWAGAIQTILGALVALGLLDLTGEQTGAIMAAVAAVLALVVRSRVTPTDRT